MARHVHADIMIAYAEDRDLQIEYKDSRNDLWKIIKRPSFDPTIEYRIFDKFRELKEAFTNGAIIERYDSNGEWVRATDPQWQSNQVYRIKSNPMPKYIPFTFDDYEMFVGKPIITKNKGLICIPNKFITEGIAGIMDDDIVPYEYLFKYFTFLDGSPFGKLKG